MFGSKGNALIGFILGVMLMLLYTIGDGSPPHLKDVVDNLKPQAEKYNY